MKLLTAIFLLTLTSFCSSSEIYTTESCEEYRQSYNNDGVFEIAKNLKQPTKCTISILKSDRIYSLAKLFIGTPIDNSTDHLLPFITATTGYAGDEIQFIASTDSSNVILKIIKFINTKILSVLVGLVLTTFFIIDLVLTARSGEILGKKKVFWSLSKYSAIGALSGIPAFYGLNLIQVIVVLAGVIGIIAMKISWLVLSLAMTMTTNFDTSKIVESTQTESYQRVNRLVDTILYQQFSDLLHRRQFIYMYGVDIDKPDEISTNEFHQCVMSNNDNQNHNLDRYRFYSSQINTTRNCFKTSTTTDYIKIDNLQSNSTLTDFNRNLEPYSNRLRDIANKLIINSCIDSKVNYYGNEGLTYCRAENSRGEYQLTNKLNGNPLISLVDDSHHTDYGTIITELNSIKKELYFDLINGIIENIETPLNQSTFYQIAKGNVLDTNRIYTITDVVSQEYKLKFLKYLTTAQANHDDTRLKAFTDKLTPNFEQSLMDSLVTSTELSALSNGISTAIDFDTPLTAFGIKDNFTSKSDCLEELSNCGVPTANPFSYIVNNSRSVSENAIKTTIGATVIQVVTETMSKKSDNPYFKKTAYVMSKTAGVTANLSLVVASVSLIINAIITTAPTLINYGIVIIWLGVYFGAILAYPFFIIFQYRPSLGKNNEEGNDPKGFGIFTTLIFTLPLLMIANVFAFIMLSIMLTINNFVFEQMMSNTSIFFIWVLPILYLLSVGWLIWRAIRAIPKTLIILFEFVKLSSNDFTTKLNDISNFGRGLKSALFSK